MPGLGRLYAPDARDDKFLMRSALPRPEAARALPTKKTWAFRTEVLDQGETGSCVGHAWKHFMICAPLCSSAKREPSAFALYDEACKLDEFTDNDDDIEREIGTTVRAGAEAMKARGLVKQYLWARSLDEVIRWLLLKGPVVMGTDWYTSMFEPDAQGVVRITPTARVAGGHAYLLRKVDLRRGLLWGPQSWGPKEGVNGHFGYPFELLERLIHRTAKRARRRKPAS